MPKIVYSEAMLQLEANTVSNTWRVSSKLGKSQFSVACHLSGLDRKI